MWFEIKTKPNIVNGPRHFLKSVQTLNKFSPPEVIKIVEDTVNRGAWHAHSENVLLSLICSDDEQERRFAIKKILDLRGQSTKGNTSVRSFMVPKINWQANSLFNLINWDGDIFEPVHTCHISKEELIQYLDTPFLKPDVPCHTQPCERAVKETTKAASKVYSWEKRDGIIRAKIKSRKMLPKVSVKRNFLGLLE